MIFHNDLDINYMINITHINRSINCQHLRYENCQHIDLVTREGTLPLAPNCQFHINNNNDLIFFINFLFYEYIFSATYYLH